MPAPSAVQGVGGGVDALGAAQGLSQGTGGDASPPVAELSVEGIALDAAPPAVVLVGEVIHAGAAAVELVGVGAAAGRARVDVHREITRGGVGQRGVVAHLTGAGLSHAAGGAENHLGRAEEGDQAGGER